MKTAPFLLILSLILCFASCAVQSEETVDSLLAAGKYDEAIQKTQESGDTAAELSVTLEKNIAEATNEVLTYVKAASEIVDKEYVYTRLIRAGTSYGYDVSSKYLWYMIELERDNGDNDIYILSVDDYKLVGVKLGRATTTATDYACTTLGVNDASALGSVFDKIIIPFRYGDLDNRPDDKLTILSDKSIARLNSVISF